MLQRKIFFVSFNEEPEYVEKALDEVLQTQAKHVCRLSNK